MNKYFYSILIFFLFLVTSCSDELSEQAKLESDVSNLEDTMDHDFTANVGNDVKLESKQNSASDDISSLSAGPTRANLDSSNKEKLKICADPYMLPFSNQNEEGYENKIANLMAEAFGMEVKYTFFPQRIGFIRNTLKAKEGNSYKCDVVITVPDRFELAATTIPYYTTSYMLVYVKGRKLDSITSPDMLSDFVNKKGHEEIKIGLTDRGPGQMWVFYNELMGNMVPYSGQPGDPKVLPEKQLIDELIAGNIDATVVMGPSAGYFAKKYKDQGELVLLPLQDDPSRSDMKFEYNFSMAVRYGETEWKEKLNHFIKENQVEIDKILLNYGIPLVKK